MTPLCVCIHSSLYSFPLWFICDFELRKIKPILLPLSYFWTSPLSMDSKTHTHTHTHTRISLHLRIPLSNIFIYKKGPEIISPLLRLTHSHLPVNGNKSIKHKMSKSNKHSFSLSLKYIFKKVQVIRAE